MIAYVCNNYAKTYDGIGDYAQKIYPRLQRALGERLQLYTFLCPKTNIVKRIFEGQTYATFKRLYKDVQAGAIRTVIIEYPFVAVNPRFLSLVKKMKTRYGVNIVLSLHEYSRVARFRQKIIEKLVGYSDIVLVTQDCDKHPLQTLFPVKKFYLRGIPSNIEGECLPCADKRGYVYFGLVNSAKAFEEMIGAWKRVQAQLQEDLYVVTSTPLDATDWEKYRIRYLYDRSGGEVAEIFTKTKFCILPIKPFVAENNTTLKTALQFSNVVIGKFAPEMQGLGGVEIQEYTISGIADALLESAGLEWETVLSMMQTNYNRGSGYGIDATVAVYVQTLQNDLLV